MQLPPPFLGLSPYLTIDTELLWPLLPALPPPSLWQFLKTSNKLQTKAVGAGKRHTIQLHLYDMPMYVYAETNCCTSSILCILKSSFDSVAKFLNIWLDWNCNCWKSFSDLFKQFLPLLLIKVWRIKFNYVIIRMLFCRLVMYLSLFFLCGLF